VKILTIKEAKEHFVHVTEHETELKNPWRVVKVNSERCILDYYQPDDMELEITKLSDMPDELENNVALLCNLLIGGNFFI
jgi:hypothetical protein